MVQGYNYIHVTFLLPTGASRHRAKDHGQLSIAWIPGRDCTWPEAVRASTCAAALVPLYSSTPGLSRATGNRGFGAQPVPWMLSRPVALGKPVLWVVLPGNSEA